MFWPLRASMRWKELLQLPVTMLPLALESMNLSSRVSASKISQRWDLMNSSTGMLRRGTWLLHISQTLREMRSLVTMLRVPSRNMTEQYLLMISLRKLLSGVCAAKVRVLARAREARESLKPSCPRLVPNTNMFSLCGCRCEQVIFQHFSGPLLSFLDNYLMRQGWVLPSMLHINALHSSVANSNSSFPLTHMLFSERHGRLGKTWRKLTETKGYSGCRCGMASSSPAERTKCL